MTRVRGVGSAANQATVEAKIALHHVVACQRQRTHQQQPELQVMGAGEVGEAPCMRRMARVQCSPRPPRAAERSVCGSAGMASSAAGRAGVWSKPLL